MDLLYNPQKGLNDSKSYSKAVLVWLWKLNVSPAQTQSYFYFFCFFVKSCMKKKMRILSGGEGAVDFFTWFLGLRLAALVRMISQRGRHVAIARLFSRFYFSLHGVQLVSQFMNLPVFLFQSMLIQVDQVWIVILEIVWGLTDDLENVLFVDPDSFIRVYDLAAIH